MHKVLISVFDTEVAAFEGVSALKELHRDGDITLYATQVISKAPNGWVSVLQSSDPGPAGTLTGLIGGSLVGLIGGSLVGLIGGPIGAAVGAYVGGVSGFVFDLFNAGIGTDFVNEAARQMTPGKIAVVADLDESWVMPVDSRLGALGAVTFRRLQHEVVDDTLVRESQAAEEEIEHLRAELSTSSGEAKAKVEAALEAQRAKVEALGARIDAALEAQREELEARLATLRAQRTEARERQKARIDARIDELKASYAARRAKLESARVLAKQAAELTREAVLR